MDKIIDNEGREVFVYTEEQLMARLRFFIGICLALTLTGIVFVVLYSIIFVTQPLNAISPIDQKFFELIIPIATFLTGTLSGIMLAGNDKDAKMKALEAATRPTPVSPTPSTGSSGGSFGLPPSKPAAFGTAPMGGMTSSFGSPAGFGAPTVTPAAPMMSSTGKPMPLQPEEPEI
jgi:hypothetical protein